MEFLSPSIMLLLGAMVLLYGVLVGGTWVRRTPGKTWNTAQPIIFIVIAAVATLHLVWVGARQNVAWNRARDRLNCIHEQIEALRGDMAAGRVTPRPPCDVHWENSP